MHRVGKLQAVHAAGHLNIGEQQRDVRAGLKNGDCLVGIDGFDGVEPGILYDVDRTHAQQHLVLDDKDVRNFIRTCRHGQPKSFTRPPTDNPRGSCSNASSHPKKPVADMDRIGMHY